MVRIRQAAMASCAMTLIGCSTVFYWNVPIRGSLPNRQPDLGSAGDVPADVNPETMCALVRQGAYDQKNRDTALGVVLGLLGGGSFAMGTALAAQSGHSDAFVGGWAAVAGVGAVVTAGAVYFLSKAGSDRQEYWIANAAVAKIHSDYTLNPSFMSEAARAAAKSWQDEKDIEKKKTALAAFEAVLTSETSDNQTTVGYALAIDNAEQNKKALAVALADASAATLLAGRLDALVTSIEKEPSGAAGSASMTGDGINAALKDVTPDKVAPFVKTLRFKDFNDSADAKLKRLTEAHEAQAMCMTTNTLATALECAAAQHIVADDFAIEAAALAVESPDASNVLTGLQQAWVDCSSAMQTIGGSDAAPYAAFAAGLSSSKGSSGGGGGKSAGGAGSGSQ